ncbi:exonuclease domain-containing protein [Moorena bouillonii]|uniref:exonuclease domain-containing protein n=1 Tax=Moorena bouillonii TaxID=207920 RepID=UPI0009D77819|nr:exonuclease domain-containing protein [Moorena bouillonii]
MYCIIDIETTGNGLKGNKITEISIFKFDGEKIVDEFTSLVNPECPIPYFITGLTGIEDETVRNAPTFDQIGQQVLDITQGCIFVAHAVNFDYGVIKEEFRRLGIGFTRKKLCTVRLSRKLIPGLRSYSLGKLCSALGIPITDRHRARGDAKATAILFKQLLQKSEANVVIKKFLNSRSQEATLPPHLNRSVVDNIPHLPGIYYFYNQKGTIIYIGKAKNLKKRVLGHFYDKSEHEIKLCREVANINFKLSGGELIALLMESAAIKEHFPKFNRAQKKTVRRYSIFSYEDRNGMLHLGFANSKQVSKPLAVFGNPTDCRVFLKQLATTYELCPKYCQLMPYNGTRMECPGNSCDGICQGRENTSGYNERVKNAINSLTLTKECVFIKQPGRTIDEEAFIYIENGVYQGYGFIDSQSYISSTEDIKAHLIRQKNTLETQRIVENRIQKEKTIFRLT